MRIVQAVPKSRNVKLKTLLKSKEKELRGKGAFHRESEGRWKHVKHPGWIQWDAARGGLLVAEVQTKKEGREWQLTQAFISFLDRHLGESIESISIYYRQERKIA